MSRAQAAVSDLPEELVFAGLSMGTGAAESLAATRPGARGAVLMHGALPPAAFGMERWPSIPVQIHYAVNDDLVNADAVRALETAVIESGASVQVFAYERGGHLFEDPASDGHDPESAALMLQRVLAFLAALRA